MSGSLDVPEHLFTAIDHVGIAVADLDAAIAFYRETFGMETVHEETNPRYHRLLSTFKARTGCPVLVNTSFNVRGEPIVRTPEDAFRCFMGSDIELLAIGNCVVRKEHQDARLRHDPQTTFTPD